MRFWIDRACLKEGYFLIKDDLYHHICRVCKIQKGEHFELFCEGLQKYEVFLDSLSKTQALAKIVKSYPVPPLKKPYLNLAVSLPRMTTFESLIEYSVQLGVKQIQPFFSEFSFFRKESEFKKSRFKRWNKIIQHHLALTGRTQTLQIQKPVSLSQIQIPSDHVVFIAYEGSKKNLKELSSSFEKKFEFPNEIWIFIGSEGGFSLRELQAFQKTCSSSKFFSMGEQILKVETAGLFALSLLKYHYDV
ncbi:MAG: 16S rRNA (uracil(1498)-N(3))-methyltransferase [Bdellovibrionales bacterium]|nr:16S rRNA (uracil(1498)-N(3))-methyltransferase [Bdellovibrionales bacterium]